MEKTVATLISVLIFSAIGYSALWQTGDAGAAFATDTAIEKCREADVSAVHICSDSVVRVVSSIPGEGSTFYKPEGEAVYCPDVDPADMGAECVQLLHPNTCPDENVCKPPESKGTAALEEEEKHKPIGVGIPDIEPDMTVPERIEPPEGGGVITQEIFIFGIIIIGMMAVALINYIYFKSKGT